VRPRSSRCSFPHVSRGTRVMRAVSAHAAPHPAAPEQEPHSPPSQQDPEPVRLKEFHSATSSVAGDRPPDRFRRCPVLDGRCPGTLRARPLRQLRPVPGEKPHERHQPWHDHQARTEPNRGCDVTTYRLLLKVAPTLRLRPAGRYPGLGPPTRFLSASGRPSPCATDLRFHGRLRSGPECHQLRGGTSSQDHGRRRRTVDPLSTASGDSGGLPRGHTRTPPCPTQRSAQSWAPSRTHCRMAPP
jgi:hypothetical protein